MRGVRAFVKDCIPPVISRAANFFGAPGIRFKGDYQTWEEASGACSGYDSESILHKVLDSTLKVKRGEAAYERDSVVFDEVEHAWPVTAGLMWAASQNNGRLEVLDFGGALGTSYFENRNFLTALPKVRWSVVEQPNFVAAGNKHISDGRLKFYESVEDYLAVGRPNVVLLSAVLQYLADPIEIIKKISSIDAQIIILDRTIISRSAVDKIHVQLVPSSIYAATYPCRSFSEETLVSALAGKYKRECKFTSLSFPALAAIGSEFNGYIFSKVAV